MSKAKELFEMVYQWGRVGVVVDETAPAYLEALKDALKELVGPDETHTMTSPDDNYEAWSIEEDGRRARNGQRSLLRSFVDEQLTKPQSGSKGGDDE